MRNNHEISVANDNRPSSFARQFDEFKSQSNLNRGEDVILQNSTSVTLPLGEMLWQPGKTRYEMKKLKTAGTDSTGGASLFASLKRLWATLISACFMLSFAGLIYGLGFADSMSVFTLGVFAFAMTFSGFIAVCFLKLPTFLKEWAALSVWLVLPVLCLAILSLAPEKVALPSAILGIIIGALSKTKTPLIAAGACLLTLGYSTFEFEGFFPKNPITDFSNYQNLGLILTNLMFLGLASIMKSRLILAIALSSVLLWGAIWLFSSSLSLQAVAAAIFIVGAAQYKLGKAGLDNRTFAAMAFIVCGWFLASGGYLWLQSSYLFSEVNSVMIMGDASTTSKPWVVLTVISVCVILVGGMSRHSHSRQSALSVFLTTIALGAIPLMVYRPELISNYVSTVPGLTVIPAVGLALAAGGVIVFTSVIVNGMRLNLKPYIALGVIGLMAQVFILLDPVLWTSLDSVVVFGTSLVVAGGLLTLFIESKP